MARGEVGVKESDAGSLGPQATRIPLPIWRDFISSSQRHLKIGRVCGEVVSFPSSEVDNQTHCCPATLTLSVGQAVHKNVSLALFS